MNKYDLTLREIYHDESLREHYSTHETKEILDCIHMYNEKILDDYQPLDIMKMIKQNLCLDEMIPLALEILRSNAMFKVESHKGDLLSVVIKVDETYWNDHQKEKKEIDLLLKKMQENMKDMLKYLDRK